jgi:hypothetical protein
LYLLFFDNSYYILKFCFKALEKVFSVSFSFYHEYLIFPVGTRLYPVSVILMDSTRLCEIEPSMISNGVEPLPNREYLTVQPVPINPELTVAISQAVKLKRYEP